MPEFEELKEKAPDLKVSDETIVETRPADPHSVDSSYAHGDSTSIAPSVNHGDDNLIGKIIGGHYEILSKLGAGGMSTVYKAKHLLLDKNVAIKFILPKLIYDNQAKLRFQQEAKASTQLSHENVCTVREFEIHEGNSAFLVMDLLDGKSLLDILRMERIIDSERALNITAQVCAGLAHAHSKGVIHRDIKPGNVMLSADDKGKEHVKIVDFGLAKLLREDQAGPNLTQTGEVFGTPLYMSPEQCLGRRVDERSDVYSVGCVLHEMIYGTPPFTADSVVEVMLHHVNEIPPINGSSDIDAVIVNCLQKNPARRYANAEELMEDIDAIRTNRKPRHAKPINPKRHKQIGIALILTTLLTAGTICGITYKNTVEQRAIHAQWSALYDESQQLIAEKQFGSAEKVLEDALVIAKSSKNPELITLSYGSLASVEQSLGKLEEALEHSRAVAQQPKTSRLRQFFIGIAVILIVVGILFFLIAVYFFGPGRKNKTFWTSSLNDLITKK